MKFFWNFCQEEDAATAVEYAVMLAMIFLAVIASIQDVGNNTNTMYEGINDDMVANGITP